MRVRDLSGYRELLYAALIIPFVCSPDGEVIARAGRGEEQVLHAKLEIERVDASHARQLFLRDRRPELYADWID